MGFGDTGTSTVMGGADDTACIPRLEYKYSKLVMDAAARESEATSPDSCAIMEGEDAEDELLFATEMSLFGKLKALTAKVRDGIEGMETTLE